MQPHAHRPARSRTRQTALAFASAAAGAALVVGGAAFPAVASQSEQRAATQGWDPDQRVRISTAELDEAAGEITVGLTITCQTGLDATVEVMIAQTVDADYRLAHGEGARDGLTCTGEPLSTTVVAAATSKTAFVVGDALIGARLETAVDVSTHARQTPVTATR